MLFFGLTLALQRLSQSTGGGVPPDPLDGPYLMTEDGYILVWTVSGATGGPIEYDEDEVIE